MILERNRVAVSGSSGGRPVVFVHGYGCNQAMWHQVAPVFEVDCKVVTYDLTGMGRSDLTAYDTRRYDTLDAHAEDLLAILEALGLDGALLVGHSVGATIALLAANRDPARVSGLVMVSPTPSFLEDAEAGYHGGFTRDDIDQLIAFLDENHLGWSAHMAPTIVGQPADEPAADDLTRSFCQTDPAIAQHFGRVTFLADARSAFEAAARPALILHCANDALVPMSVANWMETHVPGATLKILDATGHCPHMTHPFEVVAAMRQFLEQG
ncbi:alpha/beta fold hydrolase [Amaricoccus macauensis]|uniref:alpha/beta fold hydrolase n=1 Tax=Amaricoccus macauensis TaxID=57001 RepID=UPI003C7A657A